MPAAELVTSALWGWLSAKVLDQFAKAGASFRANRSLQSEIEKVLKTAVERAADEAPELAEDLSSEPFVRGAFGPAVDLFVDPSTERNADGLTRQFEERVVAQWQRESKDDAWSRIFASGPDRAHRAMEAFYRALFDGFASHENLRRFVLDRAAFETHAITEVIRDKVETIEAHVTGRALANALTVEDLARISAPLSTYPRLIDGTWMDRPEERALLHAVRNGEANRTVLIGQPGTGKSALMATVFRRLQDLGETVLAIKADTLPADITSSTDLAGPLLGSATSLASAILATARERPLFVLIDQLDAVSETVDTKTGRMYALTRLIQRIAPSPAVRIVVSARPFEFNHDGRFREALPNDQVTRINLNLPVWEEVMGIIATKVNADTLSEDTREALRNPQALVDALPLMKAGDFDDSLSSLMLIQDRRLDRLQSRYGDAFDLEQTLQVYAERALDAGEMVFIAAKSHTVTMQAAKGAGIVVDVDHHKSRFAHQTWIDTLLYRRLAEDDETLTTFVHRFQSNLLNRSRIAAILRARKGRDQPAFERELRALWDSAGTRVHVRHLLIDQAASVESPGSGTLHVIRSAISGESDMQRRRALSGIEADPTWWPRVEGEIAVLMRQPPETAWSTWPYLSKMGEHRPDDVMGLLVREWRDRPGLDRASIFAMEKLAEFDRDPLDLAKTILARVWAVGDALHGLFNKRVEFGQHDVAATIMRAGLDRLVEIAHEQSRAEEPDLLPSGTVDDDDTVTEDPTGISDQLIESMRREEASAGAKLERLLQQSHGLYDLDKKVVEAPAPYAAELLGWLENCPETGTYSRGLGRRAVRTNDLGGKAHDENLDGQNAIDRFVGKRLPAFELKPVEATHCAVIALADGDPDGFLRIVAPHRSTDEELVERIVARGFAALAADRPNDTFDYLMENGGRFSIGSWDGRHVESAHLIACLSPHLCDAQLELLVERVSAWSPRNTEDYEDAESRRRAIHWNEEDRVALLSRIADEKRSTHVQRRIDERLRANPDATDLRGFWVSSLHPVESRMSADQMAHATDDQLLRFLRGGDEDGSRYGDGRLGARAFGELTKRQPDRAQSLVPHLDPKRHDEHVGEAVGALAELDDIDPSRLLALIKDLLERGFDGPNFRHACTSSLELAAHRLNGLDDSWIDLLRSWIGPHEPNPSNRDKDREDEAPRVIVGHGLGGFIALLGNSKILSAIAAALLCREDPAVDGWLCVLEAQIDITDDLSAWWEVLRTEWTLYHETVDPKRSGALLYALLMRQPKVRDTRLGGMICSRNMALLDDGQFAEIIAAYRASSWPLGVVAAGELVAIRHLKPRGIEVSTDLIEEAFKPDGDAQFKIGVANVAATVWEDRMWPTRMWPEAFAIIERMSPTANGGLAKALARTIRNLETLPLTPESVRLFGMFAENDEIIRHVDDFDLAQKLAALLADNRGEDEILGFVETLVRVLGRDLTDMSRRSGGLGEQLLPIVLSLHREAPEIRDRTLALFEALLEIGERSVEEALGAMEAISR